MLLFCLSFHPNCLRNSIELIVKNRKCFFFRQTAPLIRITNQLLADRSSRGRVSCAATRSSSSRLRLWKGSLTDVPASQARPRLRHNGTGCAESLPAGSGEDWLCWRPVGGLRLRGATDDGPPPLMPQVSVVSLQTAHYWACRLLHEACTADDDLATVTERAKECARKWEKIV